MIGGLGLLRLYDARERACAVALAWACLWVWVARACYGSVSDSSSSESMSGGSGSSRKDGSSLGMYFSPVNVKAPESRMKSARAAIPLGVPSSSGSARSRLCLRSNDELDLFRDSDESPVHIMHEEPDISSLPDIEQDPDISFAESLRTIPDGSAPQIVPDFVALHILAEKLEFSSIPRRRHRYERRAGYRIIHECCPLVVEIKSFPGRDLSPADFERKLDIRLGWAIQDLGFQCYHFFKMYEHALRTVVIAASGDYWTYRIVTRADVPRAEGDVMDTQLWDELEFPPPVVLGTRDSDQRMKDISDYLRNAKPAQLEN